MKLRTFKQAEQLLASYIPKQIYPGELGLKRTKYFLQLLGDPQEKIKVIHIAGTSGKGSTCYLVSSLLQSQGFKVGFHQSPHLTNVRERFQIYGKIISEKEFIFYLNKIIPVIDKIEKSPFGRPSFFEILVGLAYLIFYEKKVDYAVMETGLGGWYDATNVVSRNDKLAILTKIGLDHTNILGKTIQEIAFQKAMIINDKSQLISVDQLPSAKKTIEKVVKKKRAKVLFLKKNHHFNFELNLIGDYQKENASLALAALNFLSQRDKFSINKKKITRIFKNVRFPGRFDVKIINKKTVVFDGAHNPQKMDAFITALINKYPGRKFLFLLAFKLGKDYKKMLKIIYPWADSIILTSFSTKNQDMINLSEEPSVVGKQLKTFGFSNFTIIPSLEKAWKVILNKKLTIVVTGSLYLVGEIYQLINKRKIV
jgi:dihydrofolate synthase/folylpolyglutamate synthase